MRIDSIAVTLRPRSVWEGCDLGVRLLHSRMRSVYTCYLAVALPAFLVCLATFPLEPWLPCLLVWLSKPWLDRSVLFALSRALFGETTTVMDLWADARRVLRPSVGMLLALRLSASRSFKQPIVQLEGLSGKAQRDRVRQLTVRRRGVARAMTLAFANGEFALWGSILALQVLLAPRAFGLGRGWLTELAGSQTAIISSVAYTAAVAFMEPFYVAAGFGLYLNRRVELEAWDIEQEFRRAFAA